MSPQHSHRSTGVRRRGAGQGPGAAMRTPGRWAVAGEEDLVVAAPGGLRRLAGSLRESAADLDDHAGRLGAAATAFGLGDPDFGGVAGALADDVAARLFHESSVAATIATGMAGLAAALEAADRVGLGGPLAGRWAGWGVVVIEAALLDTFAVGPDGSVAELRDALRRRRDLLGAAHGRPGPFGVRRSDAAAARLARLDTMVRQLDAIVSGRPTGWAGVGSERWNTAAGFVAAAALGRAQAIARRVELGAGTGLDGDFHEALAWADRHPFLAAAERHGAAITPGRLDLLVEIDRLLALPIEEFMDERERHLGGAPGLDWRSDGCSGPVIATAAHHCYRHDFVYRNARMLRDQWGLAPGFAEDLKELSDRRLMWEVVGDTPAWPPLWERFAWAFGVGVAVSVFGTVATPWTPPGA